MLDLKHVLRNRTTTSHPAQATKHRAGFMPVSRIVLVAQAWDEPITESSRGPARRAARAGHPKVDLTDEAPCRAIHCSAGPPVTQRSATIVLSTPKEGEEPLFKNSDEELDY
jgi:hypothetical protein